MRATELYRKPQVVLSGAPNILDIKIAWSKLGAFAPQTVAQAIYIMFASPTKNK